MSENERLLTSSEYYAYQPGLSNIPPTDEDFKRWEDQEAALNGRIPIKVCSDENAEILNAALGIGVLEFEFSIMKDFFESQKLFLDFRNPYSNRDKWNFDIVGLFEKVKDIAEVFRPVIKKFFVGCCIKVLEIQLDERRNGCSEGRKAAGHLIKKLTYYKRNIRVKG